MYGSSSIGDTLASFQDGRHGPKMAAMAPIISDRPHSNTDLSDLGIFGCSHV